MGYDVRITRKARWFEETGPVITEQDWRNVVEKRPDLEWFGHDGRNADHGVKVLNISDQDNAVLWWEPNEGCVRTKNPPGGLVERMVDIAKDLDAVVMGDEGETYHYRAGIEMKNRINVPIPFFDDPLNTANVWQMPSPTQIEALDRKHAEWVAKLRSNTSPPVTPPQASPALSSPKVKGWQIAIGIFLVCWLLWKAFGPRV